MPRARRKDAPRYASGRINYHAIARHDEAMATVLHARAARWGVKLTTETRAFLADSRHGYAIGRAELAGRLTPEQGTAGRHVAAVVEAYHRTILGLSPHPKSATLELLPEPVEAPDEPPSARPYQTHAERIKGITDRYMALEACLLNCGRDVHHAVHRMAVNDDDGAPIEPVRIGLDAVFREFGLG